MSEITYLQNVRLSFPKLTEAVASKAFGLQNPEKKWGADFILLPNDPQFAKFMGEVGKVAVEKWKEHAQVVLSAIQQDRKLRCFGNGSEKIDKKTFKPYEGYLNMVYISANSVEDKPPMIIRPDGSPIEPTNTMERLAFAKKLYGGCFVNAAVRLWPQDNQFGRGIRNELIAVQFLADGEAFGEAPPDVTGMFPTIAAQVPEAAPLLGGFPSFFGQS